MAIFWLILIFLIGAGLGRRVLDYFNFKFDGELEKTIISLCLGLGLIAYLVYIAGLLGLLYKNTVLGLLIGLTLFSFQSITRTIKTVYGLVKNIQFKDLPLFYKSLLLVMVVVFMATLIGALAPETGHDSQAYRLAQVRIFVKQHAISYLPFTRESLWPYLIEMLFALVMSISTDITAKLIAWSFGIIAAILAYTFTRKYYSKKAGILAAVIFLSTPSIFIQMAFAYVDLAFAVYSAIFLMLCYKYISTLEKNWAILAGIFGGFVLSIKYVGGITVFAAMISAAYYTLTQRSLKKKTFKGLAPGILFMILFSFAWYLRAYIIKGNPLYPFLGKVFHNHGWQTGTGGLMGTGFSLSGLFSLPLALLLDYRFGGENFGVSYLLFLPFVFLINKNKDIFKSLEIFIILYLLAWFSTMAVTNRFLFPVLLLLSMIIGCGLDLQIQKRGPFSIFVKTLLAGVCLSGLCLVVYHNARSIKVALGWESRQQYLLREERTYKVENFIDQNLPQNATIFVIGETRVYYMNRKYITFLEGLTDENRLNRKSLKAKDLLLLLNQYKIEYILYCVRKGSLPEFSLEGLNGLELLFSCNYIDREGITYKYKVFKISSGKPL